MADTAQHALAGAAQLLSLALTGAGEWLGRWYGLEFVAHEPLRPPSFDSAPRQRILLTATCTMLITYALYAVTQKLSQRSAAPHPGSVSSSAPAKQGFVPLIDADDDVARVMRGIVGTKEGAAAVKAADKRRGGANPPAKRVAGGPQAQQAQQQQSMCIPTPTSGMESLGGGARGRPLLDDSGRGRVPGSVRRWAQVKSPDAAEITPKCGVWIHPVATYTTPPPTTFAPPLLKNGNAPRRRSPTSPEPTDSDMAPPELASLRELGLVQRQFRAQARALSLRTAPSLAPDAAPDGGGGSFAGSIGRGGGATSCLSDQGAGGGGGAEDVLEWHPQPVTARTMGVSPRRLATSSPGLPPASTLPAPPSTPLPSQLPTSSAAISTLEGTDATIVSDPVGPPRREASAAPMVMGAAALTHEPKLADGPLNMPELANDDALHEA